MTSSPNLQEIRVDLGDLSVYVVGMQSPASAAPSKLTCQDAAGARFTASHAQFVSESDTKRTRILFDFRSFPQLFLFFFFF